MKVKELLARKGTTEVATVTVEETALDAARLMNEKRIGCVMVVDGDRIAGIFTERDVLRRVVAELRDPSKTKIHEVMTTPCIVVDLDETVEDCQAIITRKRVRHLPVVEDGKLAGMVTIGDIMAQSVDDHKVEIEYLHSYIYGARGSSAETTKMQ